MPRRASRLIGRTSRSLQLLCVAVLLCFGAAAVASAKTAPKKPPAKKTAPAPKPSGPPPVYVFPIPGSHFATPQTQIAFRGIPPGKGFDGRGNYTLGIRDQLIFPEIDYNKVEKVKGMNVCITTTAKTDAEGVALLKHLGMPFRAQ